jgi:cell division protein FtsN
MRTPIVRMARWLMLIVLAAVIPAAAQVVLPTNATVPASAVAVEVRVLAVPGAGLSKLGLFFPDVTEGQGRPSGFAIVLPEGESEALTKDQDTIGIHSLKLAPTSGGPAKFRVEARTAITASFPVNPPYFEVSLGFEITSKPVAQKHIALSTGSVVQIRRGPGAVGSVAPLLFETQPIKHDVQVPEGKTILLGGFFTAADAARLPDIPPNPESPVLQYVLSKKPRTSNDNEIVVLLTPRLVDAPAVVPTQMPRITEVRPAQEPALPAPPPPQEAAAVQAPQPKPVDLQPVISALVTTPEVVSPPYVAMVTPRPAPPIVTKPITPMPKRNSTPGYTVQVGAFRSSAKAEALAEKLEKQFPDVFVEEISDGNTPYRVRVGHLSNLSSAKQLRQKLLQRGIDSFVVLPPR